VTGTPLLTGREAAALAGVSYSAFRNWVAAGLLKPVGKQAVLTMDGRTRWVQVFSPAHVRAAEQATRERHATWGRLAHRVRAGHDDLMLG
jgi:predicted site-specific integrase-resolvase